jgi:hypothetical protein
MNRLTPLLLVSLLGLAACGDDASQSSQGETPPAAQTNTQREAGEAVDAIRDAARETGEAARSAADDIGERVGPALDRAAESGREMLDSARDGINNATRNAACSTARAANDAEGIQANC